jgi:hypothetical protein
MSLQIAAQHMASRGRGPDTQLMHMAPSEVAGLQALAKAHGGSLTINPDTGLPEAGFLSSILPTVIGAGLSVASGGALTPMMSAMIVGGGYGLASGSLSRGLTAGLGAYGGAGLGSALAGAGATQGLMAEGAAAQAAMGEAANAKDILLARGADTAATASPGMFGNAAASMGNAQAGLAGLGSEAGRSAFMGQIGGASGLLKSGYMAATPGMVPTVTQQPEIKPDADMGQRYRFSPGAIHPAPTPDAEGRERQYFDPTYTAIGGDEAKSVYGFADGGRIDYTYDPKTQTYALKNGQGATTVAPPPPTTDSSGGSGDSLGGGWDGLNNTSAANSTIAGWLGDVGLRGLSDAMARSNAPNYSNEGRGVDANQEAAMEAARESFRSSELSDPSAGGYGDAASVGDAGGDGSGYGDGAGYGGDSGGGDSGGGDSGGGDSTGDSGWARGGLTALAPGGAAHYNLGGYSDGGRLLKGPGDGVSDDIPAVIGDKQPARLADGEFVVPARIVSELGNGSTEAGARKLYTMMDRVQKARTQSMGKGKVAVDSKAHRLLPA